MNTCCCAVYTARPSSRASRSATRSALLVGRSAPPTPFFRSVLPVGQPDGVPPKTSASRNCAAGQRADGEGAEPAREEHCPQLTLGQVGVQDALIELAVGVGTGRPARIIGHCACDKCGPAVA